MRTAAITKPGYLPRGNVAGTYPTISLAEMERTSISVDESEKRITELIHDFGYHEFIAEDFHFAYKIYTIEETGEQVAYVVDACHSLLYHN